jgi:hypothetical protein
MVKNASIFFPLMYPIIMEEITNSNKIRAKPFAAG